jgi:hypothetical protein
MLSKKFLRDGVRPGSAASATSGITIAAVNAIAVRPVTAFSLREACAPSLPALAFGFTDTAFFDGNIIAGKGLKEDSELGWFSLFRAAKVIGIAIETEAAIFLISSTFSLFPVGRVICLWYAAGCVGLDSGR